jgi:outer membrane lipoprotein-sorting protein
MRQRSGITVTALALLLLPLLVLPAQAQPPATDILERIDRNMTYNTARMKARMTITYREGDERVLEFDSWSEGRDRSFLAFTAPARDAGSRFLRLEDAMWIFLPRVGKSVRIQGHMLRQGLMGSDFSYGDASENPHMAEDYDAVVEGSDTLEGRPVWILRLTAKRDDLSYPTRKVWVDAERWIPLQEERFALSGKLLKRLTLGDVRQLGGRWFPFRMSLDNLLQTDTATVLQVLDIQIGITIPAETFTLRHLEGGR